MSMSFSKSTQEASFHDPREEFEAVTVPVEVREDPLTGRQARIVPAALPRPDDPDFAAFVSDEDSCFFCPGNVEEVTPTYTGPSMADRGTVGEAISFPNISPYGTHSNVVVLTRDHYRPIDELDARLYRDGIRAALDFVDQVREGDSTMTFASINQNFLPPAGSSIVHPHLQTLVDDRGTTEQRRLVDAAREYYETNGRTYWGDLVDEEDARGERSLGSTGAVDWIAAFAPKHFYHVIGVVDASDSPAPLADAIEDVTVGIENVLSFYGELGMNSFNLSLFSIDDEPAVPPVVHLVARSIFDQFYVSDAPFFTTLHDEGVVDEDPETYAAEARAHF